MLQKVFAFWISLHFFKMANETVFYFVVVKHAQDFYLQELFQVKLVCANLQLLLRNLSKNFVL